MLGFLYILLKHLVASLFCYLEKEERWLSLEVSIYSSMGLWLKDSGLKTTTEVNLFIVQTGILWIHIEKAALFFSSWK